MVEVDYPHCILNQDKIRLYSHSSKSLVRPKYLGEQRVVKVMKSILKELNLMQLHVLFRVTKLLYFHAPCSTSVLKMTCFVSPTSLFHVTEVSTLSRPRVFRSRIRVRKLCNNNVSVVSCVDCLTEREDYNSPEDS